MKNPEKFVDDIISLFKYNELIKNASKTPTGFILEQKNPDWISILFLFIFIVLPAIGLMYCDFSVESIILSLVWMVSIGYTLYKAIGADNRVEFDLTTRTVEIQNLNVLTKHLFQRKTIDFNAIESIQIKSVKYISFVTSSSRLIIKTKNNKGYASNEYTSEYVARKLKFIIESIVTKNRKTNSPNKVQL
ncbi:hypothetical protein [Pontibacter akesuensis]|uniref:Uncharacterized protein n=1 Tax=Pontibacter akesuensis TaxID=388950 RepID=A0A1I7FFY8_9BACT|nr:hypothetical protein [Pontibacter akesuensis]GHA62336.1 hypothetical protein GCM10007389_13830 [Pontibacter akesuensis]SFU35100.1 hypothetical protein SAMN04487941_0173 [Pontibacter akesuensis]